MTINGEEPDFAAIGAVTPESTREKTEAYEIGYGRPPQEHRFPPGRSGNPRGRPKGARSLASVVAATLGERIAVTENGHRKRITKPEATVKQLVNRAASGENRSMQLLLALVQASDAKPPEEQPADATTEADAMVLRELMRRLETTKP